jgi:hypothetical protein
VNHSPSFTCDTTIDHQIKKGVIKDAMRLLDLNGLYPKMFKKQEKMATKLRLFKKTSSESIQPETMDKEPSKNEVKDQLDEKEFLKTLTDFENKRMVLKRGAEFQKTCLRLAL